MPAPAPGRSSAFFLLDERIQRFIWAERWVSLRDAQEAAIPLIVRGDRDVIVAAATAAGKTEAAFFPALTHLLRSEPGGLILYISPLKALINDQFGRLTRLCGMLEVPVWPWHGDISSSVKSRFLANPEGVLLITPESLEALLCNRGSSVGAAFGRLTHIEIDELHAFIGSERGKQLQSLMHRIERLIDARVPRVGLSATLGDMGLAAEYLRPGELDTVAVVVSSTTGNELKILVKGFEEPQTVEPDGPDESPGEKDGEVRDASVEERVSSGAIAGHLFSQLRGASHLIFPNSRREVERYTHLLGQLCQQNGVPNEFWPHHGNLSKEIRAATESALKQKELPATAVCTSTLELGIDIGSVVSVVQIGSPPSVASLRQRLGRSGRGPGKPTILRGYCIERALGGNQSLASELRLDTLKMVAAISLLLEGWFEPPVAHGTHLSTLVQQILSFVAQNGGASIGQLYGLMCSLGAPFEGLSKEEFAELIRHLGDKELLTQDSSGLLLHGRRGEKFVNHYSFYAAFAADEEYRIVVGGKTLGTLPVSQILTAGQRILFAGRTWRIQEIDDQERTIFVVPAGGGTPPSFSGGVGRVHTRVHTRMRELLASTTVPAYLDATAARFLAEGRRGYSARGLETEFVVDLGREAVLLTWLGDAGNEALACLFRRRGYVATPSGPGIEVIKGRSTVEDILDALRDAAIDEPPPLDMLLFDVRNLQREKWDWALPDSLLRKAYASLYLDLDEALAWARAIP